MLTIALNALCAKKEEICPAYVSKHNWNSEKQVILLIISNREKHEEKSKGKIISIIKWNNIEK